MSMPSQIWIIDDDPTYGSSLKLFLEDEHLGSVRIFERGSPACEAMRSLNKSEWPALLVLDLMLPWDDNAARLDPSPSEWSGFRVADELVKIGFPAKRIMVITALHDSRHQPLLENGVPKQNILLKPARGAEILRVVRKILSQLPTAS